MLICAVGAPSGACPFDDDGLCGAHNSIGDSSFIQIERRPSRGTSKSSSKQDRAEKILVAYGDRSWEDALGALEKVAVDGTVLHFPRLRGAALAVADLSAIEVLTAVGFIVGRNLPYRGMVHERLDGVCADSSEERVPWGVTMLRGENLTTEELTTRSAYFKGPVKVCLIDSGFERTHDEFIQMSDSWWVSGEPLLSGESLLGESDDAWDSDSYGQGTHAGGTIVAEENGMGVRGVQEGLGLHAVKILDDEGRTTSIQIMLAVQSCLNAGTQVISLNVGGRYSPSVVEALFLKTVYEENNVLIFAPAGNSGLPLKSFPASYPHVISVGAVDQEGNRASFSQFNRQVEISAPGVDICSTHPGGSQDYRSFSGTSVATSYAAGATALLWSYNPGCPSHRIRATLLLSAQNKPERGCDSRTGFGVVDFLTAFENMKEYDYCPSFDFALRPARRAFGGCDEIPNYMWFIRRFSRPDRFADRFDFDVDRPFLEPTFDRPVFKGDDYYASYDNYWGEAPDGYFMGG